MKKYYSFWRILKLLSVIFLLAFFIGCGNRNPEGRIDVTGTILLNGKPLEGGGAVVLSPINGDKDDGGRSPILNSKIHFTKRSAPKAGKYIVRIFSVQEYDTATKKPALVNGIRVVKGEIYPVKVIPDEFNINSTIEFEVRADKRNVFNYDVITDFIPESPETKPK